VRAADAERVVGSAVLPALPDIASLKLLLLLEARRVRALLPLLFPRQHSRARDARFPINAFRRWQG
jgi:hypothetical protein